MRFDILTLFPEIFNGFLSESLIKKSQEKGLIFINIVDLRDFTFDKHKTADDKPFGGGPGMVMLMEPIISALNKFKKENTKTILLTPAGEKLSQQKIEVFSKEEHIILICGRYEGIDERITNLADYQISVGDYVLSGGEIPAALFVEAVSRYIPNVVKDPLSVKLDSFSENLLDFPHYTRPAKSDFGNVPEVLINGNHNKIQKWRRKEQLRKTLFLRPDIFSKANLSNEDKTLIQEIVDDIKG